jgi:hypothetical protein
MERHMGLFDCRHDRSATGCLLCAQEDTTAAVKQQTAAVRTQTAAFEARAAEERRIAAKQAEHENMTRRWAESEAASREERAEEARLMGVTEIRYDRPMERLDGTMVGESSTLKWQMQQLAAAVPAEPRVSGLLRTGPRPRPAADDRGGAWQLLSFPAVLLALWGTYWVLFTVPGLVALAAVMLYHLTVGRLRVRRGLHRGTAGATAIALLGLVPFAWPGLDGQTDTAVKLYVAAAALALISFIPARRWAGTRP